MLHDKSQHILVQTAESIEEIMDNARAVHGEAFTNFLAFINRNSGVIKLAAAERIRSVEQAVAKGL